MENYDNRKTEIINNFDNIVFEFFERPDDNEIKQEQELAKEENSDFDVESECVGKEDNDAGHEDSAHPEEKVEVALKRRVGPDSVVELGHRGLPKIYSFSTSPEVMPRHHENHGKERDQESGGNQVRGKVTPNLEIIVPLGQSCDQNKEVGLDHKSDVSSKVEEVENLDLQGSEKREAFQWI